MRPVLTIAAMTLAPLLAAGAAHAEDRYGPTPDRAAQILPVSALSWPGKQAAPAATPAPAPAPVPTPAPRSGLPTSLYAPPPSGPSAPPLVAPGEGAPPHFYSVARQYGVQPDPIALTPQFLAESGSTDLAEPPPLPPPHLSSAQTANMSAAAATNQTRAANEAAQSASDASALN